MRYDLCMVNASNVPFLSYDDQISLAYSSDDEDILQALLDRGDRYLEELVSSNEHISEKIMLQIANGDYTSCKEYLAENRSTTSSTLAILAHKSIVDCILKERICYHSNSSKETLTFCSESNNTWILRAILSNKNTPIHIKNLCALKHMIGRLRGI